MKKVKILQIKQLENFQDEYVYDIGIGGETPYFYANNILVHNSSGVSVDPVVEQMFGEIPKKWNKTMTDKMCKYLDNTFTKSINENCAKIVKKFFLSDVSTIEFKREKFCVAGVFCAKKNYAVHVLNNEGVFEDKWIHKGWALKKSATPTKLKNAMKMAVETGLTEKWNSAKFTSFCNAVFNKFKTWNIKDFTKSIGYSTEKVFRKPFDKTGVTSSGALAANFYNDMLNYLDLTKKYDPIRVGDKFRYVYVKPNNKWGIEYIGFNDDWPEEFNEYFEIDYVENFNKFFLKPLDHFIKIYKWNKPDVAKQAITDINDL